MKFEIFTTFLLIFPSVTALSKEACRNQIRVAIVDTGLDISDSRFSGHICPTGHKNFIDNQTLNDINNHGTAVAGLIQQYAGDSNYCLLIYKYYDLSVPGKVNQRREILALQAAVDAGADIVNLSSGGPNFSEDESLIIRDNPNVTFVVAAGNDGQNIDLPGNEYYPASLFYKNMEVVEGIDRNGRITKSSNYSSKIKDKELGEGVLVMLPGNHTDYWSGTSMATAIFSGKLVDKLSKSCKYR
jgi:subtilisin family serine protease